jgi:hypothetical protein
VKARATLVLLALVLAGCADDGIELEGAREFKAYPLYWLGERFEKWELSHVELRPSGFSTFVYGDCTPRGDDHPTCSPPLQLQIQPLCAHLEVVARAPIWQHRQVRGAPVGTIDSAPVLFSSKAQIKVYRGEGSDAGLRMRALRALRSINDVEPVVGADEPIPPPARGVLAGERHCR